MASCIYQPFEKKCDNCQENILSYENLQAKKQQNEGYICYLRENCEFTSHDDNTFRLHLALHKMRRREIDDFKREILRTPQLKSLMKKVEINLKKNKADNYSSEDLKDFIKEKLNWLLCEIDHDSKKSNLKSTEKTIIMSLLTELNKLPTIKLKSKDNSQVMSNTKPLTIGEIEKSQTKVIIYNLKNITEDSVINPIGRSFYKILPDEFITKHQSHIDNLRVFRIINIDDEYCVVELKNIITKTRAMFTLEFTPAINTEIQLLESNPDCMSRSELNMQKPNSMKDWSVLPDLKMFDGLMEDGPGTVNFELDNGIIVTHKN